jgi:hypothetical protein
MKDGAKRIESRSGTPAATLVSSTLAVATGAVAIGAIAIGALAIGRLAIRRAKFDKMEIGELTIRRIHFTEADAEGMEYRDRLKISMPGFRSRYSRRRHAS